MDNGDDTGYWVIPQDGAERRNQEEERKKVSTTRWLQLGDGTPRAEREKNVSPRDLPTRQGDSASPRYSA